MTLQIRRCSPRPQGLRQGSSGRLPPCERSPPKGPRPRSPDRMSRNQDPTTIPVAGIHLTDTRKPQGPHGFKFYKPKMALSQSPFVAFLGLLFSGCTQGSYALPAQASCVATGQLPALAEEVGCGTVGLPSASNGSGSFSGTSGRNELRICALATSNHMPHLLPKKPPEESTCHALEELVPHRRRKGKRSTSDFSG